LDGTDKIDITLVEGNIDHDALTNTHNLTTDIDHDTITNYDSNEHVDHTGVTLTAGDGLDGTGDISASRTFSLDLKANGGCVIESTELAVDLGAASITGTLAIGDGGSGQTTQQAAIDILTAVSGATNEYILTKDTGTGNAVWKINSGGGAPVGASYVVLALHAELTNENVLTAGNGIDINTISGSTVTIDVDETELDSYLLPFSFSGFVATNVHDAIVEAYTDNAYHEGFANGDLAGGVLTVTHNLGRQFVNYAVYNDSNDNIIPDSAVCTSTTVLTVDLSSYGTLSGNWNIKVNA
ncbi:hypothetical protein LCGC14_3083930, partial [marine sediment metagenome]